ncbi:CoA-binding protein [Endothiovibrio diazotrophicus]
MVGLSPKPARPSYWVSEAMQGYGYEIVPVRPATEAVLGVKAYPTLADVPGRIDLVDVFRAPEHVGPIVDACIEREVPYLWLQEGVVNPAEASRAAAAGITVVMDRCIYKDYLAFATKS